MLSQLAGSSAPNGRVGSPASRSPSGRGPEEDPLVSTFVIVPGAWDTPATMRDRAPVDPGQFVGRFGSCVLAPSSSVGCLPSWP